MRLYSVPVRAEHVEVVSDRCWQHGAQGIWERPGREGIVELRVGVEDGDAAGFEAALADRSPFDVTAEAAVDLATRTVEVTTAVGTMVVEVPPTVFGDGRHPTTRTCASLLTSLVRPGDRALDVGCGAGVLSLVAAAAGGNVTAVDLDPAAVAATAANAANNGVPVTALTGSLDAVTGTFDIVVANISANTVLALADALVARATRSLVVSGILPERWDEVRTRLALPVSEEREIDGWVTAVLRCAL